MQRLGLGFGGSGVEIWIWSVVRASFEALPFCPEGLLGPSWILLAASVRGPLESPPYDLYLPSAALVPRVGTSEERSSLGARCGLPGCWAAWLYLPSPRVNRVPLNPKPLSLHVEGFGAALDHAPPKRSAPIILNDLELQHARCFSCIPATM